MLLFPGWRRRRCVILNVAAFIYLRFVCRSLVSVLLTLYIFVNRRFPSDRMELFAGAVVLSKLHAANVAPISSRSADSDRASVWSIFVVVVAFLQLDVLPVSLFSGITASSACLEWPAGVHCFKLSCCTCKQFSETMDFFRQISPTLNVYIGLCKNCFPGRDVNCFRNQSPACHFNFKKSQHFITTSSPLIFFSNMLYFFICNE